MVEQQPRRPCAHRRLPQTDAPEQEQGGVAPHAQDRVGKRGPARRPQQPAVDPVERAAAGAEQRQAMDCVLAEVQAVLELEGHSLVRLEAGLAQAGHVAGRLAQVDHSHLAEGVLQAQQLHIAAAEGAVAVVVDAGAGAVRRPVHAQNVLVLGRQDADASHPACGATRAIARGPDLFTGLPTAFFIESPWPRRPRCRCPSSRPSV